MAFKNYDDAVKQKISFAGNNVKSMRNSVEASLKKLRTSYVDVLYVHWWEYEVSIEEVMSGLHNLVVQGKVLYLVCLVCMNFLFVSSIEARARKTR
jgi:aryl-alcohol dehydrogenase-like predicted oxidoreductase